MRNFKNLRINFLVKVSLMTAMDHNVDEPFLCACDGEKVRPDKLLEECWFFGNFLDFKQKTNMSSTSSHPSSNHSPESRKSFEETYESIKKSSSCAGESWPSDLPCVERKGIDAAGRMKLVNRKASPKSLLPSEELEDEEEMEFSMGKLIRQASLNSNSDTMTPRTRDAKGVTTSSGISRKNWVSELKTQKNLSTMGSHELEGFENLGLEHKNLKPGANGITPVLQERMRREGGGGGGEKRSSLRRTQSWAPPVPVKPGGKKTSEEDIKAQIKFWARAVASNARPEC